MAIPTGFSWAPEAKAVTDSRSYLNIPCFFFHSFIYFFLLLYFRQDFPRTRGQAFLSVSSSFLLHGIPGSGSPWGGLRQIFLLPVYSPSSVCTVVLARDDGGDWGTGTQGAPRRSPCLAQRQGRISSTLGGSSSCCSLLSVTHSGNFP